MNIKPDEHGNLRFPRNAIVEHLLDNYDGGLNLLRTKAFSDEDWKAFTKLLGYSLRGWSELSFVTPVDIAEAEASASGKDPRDARIAALEEELAHLNQALNRLRGPLMEIFGDYLEPRK